MLPAFLVFFPFAAAVLCALLGRRPKPTAQNIALIAATALEAAGALALLFQPSAAFVWKGFCHMGLHFAGGSLPSALCLLAALLFFLSSLNHPQYFAGAKRVGRYTFFLLLTEGALMGVFLSQDLFTTLVFFECMSFASYVWVVQNETKQARFAADTYLAVAVIGGLSLLMGLFVLYAAAGTLNFDQLALWAQSQSNRGLLYGAGCCLLVGFGAKAGLYPMHIWLPRAHPVAPAPASALLSGILTKSGVFGLLVVATRLFYGDIPWGVLMLSLGTVTMVLGAVLALLSIDLKRTLACSSLSQIGFITVGVGSLCLLGRHGALASAGVVLHITNHALVKLTLFLCAGLLYLWRHTLDLNRLRGAGRGKALLTLCFLLGAMSIGGVPGTSGYISKTLLHEALVEIIAEGGAAAALARGVEIAFLLTGGLTVAYMLKIFVVLFVEKPTEAQPARPISRLSALAIAAPAAALPVCGLLPHASLDRLAAFAAPFLGSEAPHAPHYFAWVNLKGAVFSLTIGILLYTLAVRPLLSRKEEGRRVYIDRWPVGLDLETRLYRPALNALGTALTAAAHVLGSLVDWLIALLNRSFFSRGEQPVHPPEDAHFGQYNRPQRQRDPRESLAWRLVLIGGGITVALLTLLLP